MQERVLDAKRYFSSRYFLERENMPYQITLRIGEYNKALEHSLWVKNIIWNDCINSRLSLAARYFYDFLKITLRQLQHHRSPMLVAAHSSRTI